MEGGHLQVRVEPQGSFPRRGSDTSTSWKIIYCIQFPSCNMSSTMLLPKVIVVA